MVERDRQAGQQTYDLSSGTSFLVPVQARADNWFGPLNPMPPSAPAQVASRQWDFPSGYNLALKPKAYEPIGFPELRAFADGYDLLRLVIENRKDAIDLLKWNIKPRDQKKKSD